MNKDMQEDAAKYWVGRLNDAIDALKQISEYNVNTMKETEEMRQIAKNFLDTNGYSKPSEVRND
jgi:isopropylmalate/homocitrate/citramalate synthase